jgi:hypothetical protein
LPPALDMVLTFLFLGGSAHLNLHVPRELARLFVLLIVAVPNIFILLDLVPQQVVYFVMLCQYVCLDFTIVYRVYSMTTSQKDVPLGPLRPVLGLSMLVVVSGFMYLLSQQELVSGAIVWKGVYTSALVVLHGWTLYSVRSWLHLSSRIFEVLAQRRIATQRATFMALLVGYVLGATILIGHLAMYQSGGVFFSSNAHVQSALEWAFAIGTLIWTTVRNLEVRKSEIDTMVRECVV